MYSTIRIASLCSALWPSVAYYTSTTRNINCLRDYTVVRAVIVDKVVVAKVISMSTVESTTRRTYHQMTCSLLGSTRFIPLLPRDAVWRLAIGRKEAASETDAPSSAQALGKTEQARSRTGRIAVFRFWHS